ncbi:MAG: amino acid ABC transporter permease [Opitutales bacterium]
MSHAPDTVTPRFRILDCAVLLVIVGAVSWFLLHAFTSFNYDWDWAKAWEWISDPNESFGGLSFYASTILNTLKITLCVVLLASILGFIGGLSHASNSTSLRVLSTAYVATLRNLPPLVSIFILHFFLTGQLIPLLPLNTFTEWLDEGSLRKLIFASPDAFEYMLSGIIALSIIEGAFITEIVRGGLKGIPPGQEQAGRSLGMNSIQTLRFVLIPQLLKIIRLPMGNSVVSILKNTAILSLISVHDLTFAAQDIANSNSRIFEIWIITGVIYFLLGYSADRILKAFLAR